MRGSTVVAVCTGCALVALIWNFLHAASAPTARAARLPLAQASGRVRAALGMPAAQPRAAVQTEMRRRTAALATAAPVLTTPVTAAAIASPPLAPPANCSGTAHVELWGALVLPGDSNLHATADGCCQSCREYDPTPDVLNGSQCNAWVWHPVTQHCWLKYESAPQLEAAVRALSKPGNPKVPWTSGVWLEHKPCADCVRPVTFNGCISKDQCNTTRACGSPAIDGYSHVNPQCFAHSPTALLYKQLIASGVRLVDAHELKADYDGLGVRWGIGHTKQNWEDCARACREHVPGRGGGPYATLPCNAWTWCSQPVCFEPDAHSHHFGDCWLKFTELPHAPEVNMREPMRRSFLRRHRTQMAAGVPWVSGVLLPPGVTMTSGTWGPRAFW